MTIITKNNNNNNIQEAIIENKIELWNLPSEYEHSYKKSSTKDKS